MAPKGVETILGMKRDKAFGALLMFGLGGVMVEVLKDVTFRIAPINEVSADMMITSIKAYKLLQAFRGQPAVTSQRSGVLLRLSQLVTDFPEFDEIDINPLLAYEEGKEPSCSTPGSSSSSHPARLGSRRPVGPKGAFARSGAAGGHGGATDQAREARREERSRRAERLQACPWGQQDRGSNPRTSRPASCGNRARRLSRRLV